MNTISDNARQAAEKILDTGVISDSYVASIIQSAMDAATADKDAVIAGLREELSKETARLNLLVNNFCVFKSTSDGNYWFVEADLKGETFRDAIDARFHPEEKRK